MILILALRKPMFNSVIINDLNFHCLGSPESYFLMLCLELPLVLLNRNLWVFGFLQKCFMTVSTVKQMNGGHTERFNEYENDVIRKL